MLDDVDRLGIAAAKYVTAELGTFEQLFGGRADRFEAAQPERELVRHVGGAHAFRAGRVRQQQSRFEIGEPRRHHQIIGRKFDAQPPHLLDEGEVLVRERENGDFRQVDLLLAGEREQEIERALETLYVDDQRALVGGEIGRIGAIGSEMHDFGGHHTRAPCAVAVPAASSIKRANSARAAARSTDAGARRVASAAVARVPARPASSGAALATASISLSEPLQWSAMSQPAASAADVRSAKVPDKAPIERSSVIKRPSNPIHPRIT